MRQNFANRSHLLFMISNMILKKFLTQASYNLSISYNVLSSKFHKRAIFCPGN